MSAGSRPGARWPAVRARIARHPFLVDAALAAGLAAALALLVDREAIGSWPVLAGLTVPLAWRRRSYAATA